MFGLSDLAIKALIFAAIVAAVGAGLIYVEERGASRERAIREAENQRERADRAAEIGALNTDLSDAVKEREEHRAAEKVASAQLTAERKTRRAEFIPQVADSASCLRVGWVRYIDAAAAGVPLGERLGPGVATAPAGLKTDDAADIIASNYDVCLSYKKRVKDILVNFDDIRGKTNSVVDRINARLKAAERKVQ